MFVLNLSVIQKILVLYSIELNLMCVTTVKSIVHKNLNLVFLKDLEFF